MSEAISSSELRERVFPFRAGGFFHGLLEQDGPVCLVKRTRVTTRPHKQLHYEVVLLQWHPVLSWPDGRQSPEGWNYPPSESWGEYGWTYRELAKARLKYDEIRSKTPSELPYKAKKGGSKPPVVI